MRLRALALDWRIDSPDATVFLVLVAAIGTLYLLATARGNSRERRGRRSPRGRSVCFIAGLGVLVVDLYSGIGAQADQRLSAHMLEHMAIRVMSLPYLPWAPQCGSRSTRCLGAAAGRWRGGWTRASCRQSPP
jgi:Cytochrome c oxidase caa3 assembly factor (Caa3_CtaG)